MLEGKALVIAVMMLTAAPIAATDPGQAFITDITDNVSERFESTDPNHEEILPDKDTLLEEENNDVPCYTPEEWKALITERENYVEEERKEDVRARGTDDKKDDYDEKDYLEKKEVVTDKEDCLTVEEWNAKFESDEREPCFTLADLEKKMKDDRKDWDKDGKDWDREDKDWERDEDWEEKESDEAVEDEERDEEESEDAADGRDHEDGSDEEEWTEFRAAMVELKEACEEGDEEACLELREIISEMIEEREESWDKEHTDWDKENKDWDRGHTDWDKERGADEACLTMEQWKEKFGKDKNDKDERWAYSGWSHDDLRTLFIVLEKDCEAGSDVACEQLAILEENKEKFAPEHKYDTKDRIPEEAWTALATVFKESDLTDEEMALIQEELGMDDAEFQELVERLEQTSEEKKEGCGEHEDDETDEDDSNEDNSDEE